LCRHEYLNALFEFSSSQLRQVERGILLQTKIGPVALSVWFDPNGTIARDMGTFSRPFLGLPATDGKYVQIVKSEEMPNSLAPGWLRVLLFGYSNSVPLHQTFVNAYLDTPDFVTGEAEITEYPNRHFPLICTFYQ